MSDTPPSLLRLTAPVELQAAAGNSKPRRLRIVAYRGGIMKVFPQGPVVLSLAGMQLPQSLPLLDAHGDSLDAVIGAGRPSAEDEALVIAGTVAPAPVADRVISLLDAGVPLEASIVAQIVESRRLAPAEKARVNGREVVAGPEGLLIVRQSQLREVSILPLG